MAMPVRRAPRWLAATALMLPLAALGVTAGVSGASAPVPTVPVTATLRPVAASTALSVAAHEDRVAERILLLVNRRREHHGLRPVRAQRCVNGFSSDWVDSLTRRDVLEHSNLDRLLNRCDAPYASENLAEVPPGYGPRRIVRLWMHSAAHRHNILSPRPTASGVGVRWDPDQAMWVVVQNFARRPRS